MTDGDGLANAFDNFGDRREHYPLPRGCSSVVEHGLPKPVARVRFPSPALSLVEAPRKGQLVTPSGNMPA